MQALNFLGFDIEISYTSDVPLILALLNRQIISL
jgi:hypothetical protein